MNKELTFKEWLNSILYLKDKVILPNGDRMSKGNYISSEGIFDTVEFNRSLFKEYIKQQPPRPDGTRLKAKNNE